MTTLTSKLLLLGSVFILGFGLTTMLPAFTHGYEGTQLAQNFTTEQENPGLNVPGGEGLQGEGLLNVIRNAINRILGLLGFITLIILLYGGFQMVTAAGNEEKYNSGFTILKQAGIGLLFIGLARFAISLIFFFIRLITG